MPPSLQPLDATNSRQIIDINYRWQPLFALTNSPSLMIPIKNTYCSSPGHEIGCFMAFVAYVDCDTDVFGCTVTIAIMEARCLNKEGYAGNHPAAPMYGADGWENVEAPVRATELLQMDGK
ncbi:hypothetical protein Tco_0437923 [Tanacetum coccineum]